MICFVSSLSASTVTSLYYYFEPEPGLTQEFTEQLERNCLLARSHQDRRTVINRVGRRWTLTRKRNPRIRVVDQIYVKTLMGTWSIFVAFILIRFFSSPALTSDELYVIAIFATEVSLLAYFLRFSAKYFLQDRSAQRHWALPSFALFVFLTFPFAFSLARTIYLTNHQ